MVCVFILAMLVLFYGMSFVKSNEFNTEYMSRETTGAVNGIFVLFVFMSHISNYMDLGSTSDKIWLNFRSWLGQLMVVTFLFYSGYGMMCSIMKKGNAYIKPLFKNKFLNLLLHFDIAVALFVIMNLALGVKINLKNTLLAFTTWTSIGNSNWYITIVLGMYLIIILAFSVFRKHELPALISVSVLTVVFACILIKAGKQEWYYNTLLVFPVGMWYAYFKKYIDKFVMKNNTIYMLFMLVISAAVVLFAVCYKFRGLYLPVYWVYACSFMMLIVLITMKVKIGNPILSMLGRHVFSIYILQRIPMTVFKRMGLNANNMLFFFLCFAVTLLMSAVFDMLMKKLDKKLFA